MTRALESRASTVVSHFGRLGRFYLTRNSTSSSADERFAAKYARADAMGCRAQTGQR